MSFESPLDPIKQQAMKKLMKAIDRLATTMRIAHNLGAISDDTYFRCDNELDQMKREIKDEQ